MFPLKIKGLVFSNDICVAYIIFHFQDINHGLRTFNSQLWN